MQQESPQVEFAYDPVWTYARGNSDILRWIQSLLTVPDPTGWPPEVPFFDRSNNAMLSGHLHWVENHLVSEGIPYAVYGRENAINYGEPDPRILSTQHHPDFVLKRYQISTTRKMVMGRRGGVQLATGAGKTASYIAALKWLEQIHGSCPSLTIVTVTNLAKQMASRMKHAGLNAAIMKAGKWGNADHVVSVVNGLHSSWQKRDPHVLRMLGNRRVLCLDEAHHGQADMCFNVATACHAENRWMLSATLYANRANPYMHVGDMRIMGISGPTLATLPARFLWENGHIAEPTITFIPMHWPPARRTYGFRAGGRWNDTAVWRGQGKNAGQTGVEWDLIVNNYYRNEFIRRLVYWKTLAEPDHAKFVILVQRLDHGRILQQMLSHVGIISACAFGGSKVVTTNLLGEQREWIDRKDKTLASFDSGELRVLIGSQKFDEGQSFPLFTDLILAQAGRGGEANRRVYQRVGRGLHSGIPVRVWDMYDQTHGMVQRQAEARLMALHNEDYPVEVGCPPECMWEIPGL